MYRAFDTRRGRVVALKILAPGLEQEQDFRARFRRESDNAARLQDPHVIPIHDFGEIGGRLYIDMRLVEGTGLDDLVAAGPLSPPRAVSLIGQVAEALTDAHVHDVVHRDVKPSNILVTPTDFVYLVDFGIARALDDDHTSASDTPALIHAHLSADPPQPSLERPDVPRALDEVIARGMAKDPAARYASARDFAAAAQYALTSWGRPQHWAPPQPEPTRPGQVSTALLTEQSPPRRRRPGTAALITGALLLTAVSGGTGFALGRLDAGGAQAPTDTRTTPTSVVAAPAGPSAATPAPAAPATVDPSAAIPTAATRTGVGAPAAPATGGKRPSAYRYSIDSNYPINLVYVDSKGDQTTVTSTPAPWTVTADTAAWGANAYPMLIASSMSTKGDTTVTCTIADDQGHVLDTKTSAAAFASVSCAVYP